MKWLLVYIFILISCTLPAQIRNYNFSSIDAMAEDIDANSPDTLAHLLTAPYTTDLEKVRSIFYWITSHIEYNTIRYQPRFTAYKNYDDDSIFDDDSVLKPLDERVAILVLKRRYALCDGYARLFKTLCDYAGIKSVVITGYARNGSGSKQFRCNHKWNAVMIDSNWYLLDATWASGYLNYNGSRFIHDFNDNYFLTPPKYFIRDHYPDDIKWTLLDEPVLIPEFKHSPFKLPFSNYQITSYFPAKGIINATIGDTIKITLNTTEPGKTLSLSDLNSADSADIAIADSTALADKNFVISNDNISAKYIVTNISAQWLQVIYNNRIILRYKLNIIKQPFPYPAIQIKDIADIR